MDAIFKGVKKSRFILVDFADKVILIDSEKIKFSRFAYELNLLVAEYAE